MDVPNHMLYQFCFETTANSELLLLLLPSNVTVHCLTEIHSKKTKHILLCLHPHTKRRQDKSAG